MSEVLHYLFQSPTRVASAQTIMDSKPIPAGVTPAMSATIRASMTQPGSSSLPPN
jgi:hypothetical protein